MHEIRPSVWLGSLRAAEDRDTLAKRGVTHVLSLAAPVDMRSRQRFRPPPSDADPLIRLWVSVEDSPSARLDRHFAVCSAFIAEAIAEGGVVLVHCAAGQSRSPAMVMAHLMIAERCTVAAALEYVRWRRPTVRPNAGFMTQLRSLEVRLGSDGPLATVLKCYDDAVAEDDEYEGDEEDDASQDEVDDALMVEAEVRKAEELPDAFGAAETLARCDKLRARLAKFCPPPGAMRKRRFT